MQSYRRRVGLDQIKRPKVYMYHNICTFMLDIKIELHESCKNIICCLRIMLKVEAQGTLIEK